MISAFGVEHDEIAKGFRLPGGLKSGEMWHGTTPAGAAAIKSGGFKLANPKNKPGSGSVTRAGREMTRGGAFGPGVYMTRSKREAKSYGGVALKVRHSAKLAPARVNGRQTSTVNAAKQGFGGVGNKHVNVVGDPRKVSLA